MFGFEGVEASSKRFLAMRRLLENSRSADGQGPKHLADERGIKFSLLTFLFTRSKLVLIAVRVHPFPSRTRKLSSFAPKILVWRRTGKIGNANTWRD